MRKPKYEDEFYLDKIRRTTAYQKFKEKHKSRIDKGTNSYVRKVVLEPASALAVIDTSNVLNYVVSRGITGRGVDGYVRQFQDGVWREYANPFLIGLAGEFLEGNHRARACIQSGISLKVDFEYGLDPKIFDGLGVGLIRTPNQHFGMAGVDHPSEVSAAVRCIINYNDKKTYVSQGFKGRRKIHMPELLAFEKEYHDELQYSFEATRTTKKKLVSSARAVTHHFVGYAINPKLTDKFWEMFCNWDYYDDSLITTNVERLVDHLVNNLGKPTLFSLERKDVYIIKQWRACQRGIKRSRFRWDSDKSPKEEFPVYELLKSRFDNDDLDD